MLKSQQLSAFKRAIESSCQAELSMNFFHNVGASSFIGRRSQKYHTKHITFQGARGVDYVVIGFDMEVQPLVTHNAA